MLKEYELVSRIVRHSFIVLVILGMLTVADAAVAQRTTKKARGTAEKSTRAPKEVASAMWKRIASARSGRSIEKDNALYWIDIYAECSKAFRTVDQASDSKKALKYFVDQFGKHGPEADMRWLLVGISFTVPLKEIDENAKQKWPAFAKTQVEISEQIVRRCLTDRKFLDRYYRAVLWSGFFLAGRPKPTSLSQELRIIGREFAKKDNPWYWYYARNFVILVRAFGRDDLLKGVDPGDLRRVYPAFSQWYEKNKNNLIFDRKKFQWKLPKAGKEGEAGKRNLPERLQRPTVPFPKSTETPPPSDLLYEMMRMIDVW